MKRAMALAALAALGVVGRAGAQETPAPPPPAAAPDVTAPPEPAEAEVPPAAPEPEAEQAAPAATAEPAPPPPPVLIAPPPRAPAQPASDDTMAAAYEDVDVDDDDEPDDGTLGSHQDHWLLGAAVRVSRVSDEGFDLFSEDDAMAQFTLQGGRALLADGPLSLVALGGWDYGKLEDRVRGSGTELDVHRLWLAAEGRYHVLRRLYGFGRVAPALLHAAASLRDTVAGADREASAWGFGVDASLGAAFEAFGRASGSSRRARGWVSLEGGYGFASSTELMLEAADDSSAPIRTAAVDLGELSLNGPFVRVGFALTF